MNTAKELQLKQRRVVNAGFLLAFLCLLDAVFTDIGLRNGHIQEANMLVSALYEHSIPLYYTVKLSLPLLLLYIVTKTASGVLLNVLLTTALFLYIAVLFVHLFWLIIISI